MTVCIAAITVNNEIVTVSDTMITGLVSSADANTVKMDPFAKDWSAMWAGEDITQCAAIIERTAEYFQNRANTLRTARYCLKKAYQQHLCEMAVDEVLGRFGVDMKQFFKSRSKRFTDTTSERLIWQMQQVRTEDLYFLGFGFDAKKQPHIFTVEEPGRDYVHDKPGFCAIGSGKVAAEGLLFHVEQSRICTLQKTLINLLFAKFMAEKAGAGRHTYILALKHGSTMCAMPPELEPTVRSVWEKEVSPKVPDDLLRNISAMNIRLF
jgi:hypothetical protein